MIDAHCHLYDTRFAEDEIEEVVERAKAAGVVRIVCAGGGEKDNEKAVKLAERFPEIWATVGIHPEEMAHNTVNEQLIGEQWEKWGANNKVVAVGEIGLDFYEQTTDEERKIQMEWFEMQVVAAEEMKLPVVVHNRNADSQIKEVLERYQVTAQLHCFVGDRNMVDWAMGQGHYVSFGGIVTFRNRGSLEEAVKSVETDRLLIETDAPYLAPEPMRGERNEPANVKIVAEEIAKIRNVAREEIEEATQSNAFKIFKRMK